jgi:hypothetical protein
MPPPLTWHIFQIIVDVLSPIVSTYVFNQFKGCWLSNDALNYTIFICFEILSYFDNFMEDESIFVFELGFLAFNIKK